MIASFSIKKLLKPITSMKGDMILLLMSGALFVLSIIVLIIALRTFGKAKALNQETLALQSNAAPQPQASMYPITQNKVAPTPASLTKIPDPPVVDADAETEEAVKKELALQETIRQMPAEEDKTERTDLFETLPNETEKPKNLNEIPMPEESNDIDENDATVLMRRIKPTPKDENN